MNNHNAFHNTFTALTDSHLCMGFEFQCAYSNAGIICESEEPRNLASILEFVRKD